MDQTTETTSIECTYCGATVTEPESVPAVYDHAAWAALTADHSSHGCEWVQSRAHRVDLPEAERLARRALEGRDRSLDGQWREAGYASPVAAAEAMVGDLGDSALLRVAAEIVAAEIG